MSNIVHATLFVNENNPLFCKRPFTQDLNVSSMKSEITCLDCLFVLKSSQYEDDDYFANRYKTELYKQEFQGLLDE